MGSTPVGSASDFDGRDIFSEELTTSRDDSKATPLYQRLLSALISEDSTSVNDDLQFGAEDESELSVLNHMEFNGYRTDRLELDEPEDDVSVMTLKGINSSAHNVSGRFSDHISSDFSDIPYQNLGIDEKIYMEAQSIGICLEPMVYSPIPRSSITFEMLLTDVIEFGFGLMCCHCVLLQANISNMEDEGIVDEIKTLEEAIYEVVCFLTCFIFLFFNSLSL